MSKLVLAVFASGNGSNLQSIIDHCAAGKIDAEIRVVVCNKPGLLAIERAKKHEIPVILEDHRNYPTREAHEEQITKRLDPFKPELIVLAGYMRVLTPGFIRHWYNKKRNLPGIMNIHPALLPSFPGTHAYQDAFNYGVKLSGITVHFIDEGIDTGPIILQESFPRLNNDTLDKFCDRGLQIEHILYPQAINLYANDRLEIRDRYVVILESREITQNK